MVWAPVVPVHIHVSPTCIPPPTPAPGPYTSLSVLQKVVEPENEVLERYMNVFTAVNDEAPSWALVLNHVWARSLGLITKQIQQQLPPEECIHPHFCQDLVLYANPRPETLGELLPSDSALWQQVVESLKQARPFLHLHPTNPASFPTATSPSPETHPYPSSSASAATPLGHQLHQPCR